MSWQVLVEDCACCTGDVCNYVVKLTVDGFINEAGCSVCTDLNKTWCLEPVPTSGPEVLTGCVQYTSELGDCGTVCYFKREFTLCNGDNWTWRFAICPKPGEGWVAILTLFDDASATFNTSVNDNCWAWVTDFVEAGSGNIQDFSRTFDLDDNCAFCSLANCDDTSATLAVEIVPVGECNEDGDNANRIVVPGFAGDNAAAGFLNQGLS